MLANSLSLSFARTRARFLSLAHKQLSLPVKFIGWTSLLANLVSLSLSLFLCLSLSHSLTHPVVFARDIHRVDEYACKLPLSLSLSLSHTHTHTHSCRCQ